MEKIRKTIKVEVEITFEYDKRYINSVIGIGESYADATAREMVLCNASNSIEEGVQIIQVSDDDRTYFLSEDEYI